MKLPSLPFADAFRSPEGRPAFDAASVQRTVTDALQAAGLDTTSGPMKNVSDTIQRALAAAGLGASTPAAADSEVIDVVAREIETTSARDLGPAVPKPGRMVDASHTGPAGTRSYKLYVPAAAVASTVALPLVVMLHGCTQTPDDFAAGTRMNELAERDGFIVAYPAQSKNANGSNCWNWFRPQDQTRDGGEPSLLAGIVRDVAAAYPVDPKRIFVAGLSAGGAMAAILGETYPELFAGIAVHSGLATGAAHDVGSAFAAMNTDPRAVPQAEAAARSGRRAFVPTIVFHGDRDTTVNPGNGWQVVARALDRARAGGVALRADPQAGQTGGHRYARTVHADAAGRPQVEHWVVHGSGHAWSGGSAAGSYTDPAGPDASDAMARFFLAQAREERNGG